jgi:hypothetical protein
MAVHLGDYANDLLGFASAYPHLTLCAVGGNCDYGTHLERERMLAINGRSLLLVHGHTQNVKTGLDRLAYYAEEKQAHVCLFGHTHQPAMFDRGRVFFFNPGSVSLPRDGGPGGYGLLQISDNGIIKGTLLNI